MVPVRFPTSPFTPYKERAFLQMSTLYTELQVIGWHKANEVCDDLPTEKKSVVWDAGGQSYRVRVSLTRLTELLERDR
jgi:hypothetical protein